jgi:hypothetical protein
MTLQNRQYVNSIQGLVETDTDVTVTPNKDGATIDIPWSDTPEGQKIKEFFIRRAMEIAAKHLGLFNLTP